MQTETIKLISKETDYFNPNSLISSEVENTFTFDCCFNILSSDQISQLYFNAAAKYCTSFVCFGRIDKATLRKGINFELGIISTLSSKINKNFVKFSDDLCVFNNIYSLCFLISESTNSGVIRLTSSETIISAVLSPLIIAAKTILASTTSIIQISFLYFSDTASLTLLPNMSASSSVNSLSDAKYFIKANCCAFFEIARLATSSQSSLNSCIVFSNSSEISIFNSAILSSQNYYEEVDYIKLSHKICNHGFKKQVLGEQWVQSQNTTGSVGIGTAGPNFLLDVAGKANVTGVITNDASGAITTCNIGEIRGNATANKICLCTTANLEWK